LSPSPEISTTQIKKDLNCPEEGDKAHV
jgi:hypothetical protein